MNVYTDAGNIGEFLFKTAEFRLFDKDRKRLFQCALQINSDKVKITLAASFMDSDIKTLREVKDALLKAGFKAVEFERKLGGKVKLINLE